MKEVEAKIYVGLFDEIPFRNYIQSPIGLVPKSNGDVRLIFHLSYPRKGKKLVNVCTPKDLCSVKYKDLPNAIKLCSEAGRGCHTAKADIKSAFRNLPIRPADWMLTVMKASHPQTGQIYYFVDKCLPFLCKKRSGKNTNNYLDDFLFAALLKALCDGQVKEFMCICQEINFPITPEKTVLGTRIIVFLGFLINTLTTLNNFNSSGKVGQGCKFDNRGISAENCYGTSTAKDDWFT